MLTRFLPKTLVGQFIGLLAIVLIIAQIINLALLVGTQRYQAQSSAYQIAIGNAVQFLSELPEDIPTALPYRVPLQRGSPRAAVFLSLSNGALENKEAKTLPRYNMRFKTLLAERGITVLQTSVTHLPNEAQRSYGGNARTDKNLPPPLERTRPPRPLPPEGISQPSRPPRHGSPNSRRPNSSELQEIRISAKIKDGIWFNAFIPHPKSEALTGRILLATSLLLGLSLLAVWLFARRLSRPLSNFTYAAEQLGRGETIEFLSETGPGDMRQAASAFNAMQSRLIRMLDTQRTMLRAVGHDLRTPLTFLRLRAENIEDDVERNKVISTLNDMTIMTEEILNWAKDASGTEGLASVDLEALLQTIVDDYEDQGKDISLSKFRTFPIKIRRTAIKRALQNLINNALEYGGRTELSVECINGMTIIHIDDYGLGVPAEKIDDILKPFVRVEPSRNKGMGGTGLGLTITEAIAQNHGGSLHLLNRECGGFRASLYLPI